MSMTGAAYTCPFVQHDDISTWVKKAGTKVKHLSHPESAYPSLAMVNSPHDPCINSSYYLQLLVPDRSPLGCVMEMPTSKASLSQPWHEFAGIERQIQLLLSRLRGKHAVYTYAYAATLQGYNGQLQPSKWTSECCKHICDHGWSLSS